MPTEPVNQLAVKIPTASKMIDTPESTIAGWLREGRLRGVKVGRSWRVRVSDLQALLDAQR